MEQQKHAIEIKNISQFCEWADSNHVKLFLPILQRDYVWGKEQWNRLWKDIIDILNKLENPDESDKNPQHFTGILTLKKDDAAGSSYSVLDGQQRLTTISVLLDYLNYITSGKSGSASLGFFTSNVLYDQDVQCALKSDVTAQDQYLSIYRFFMDCHYEMDYAKADKLLDIVLHRLFFMVKIIEGENEHEIFENLNATGKNLEFADLILNELIEECEEAGCSATAVKKAWTNMLESLYRLSVPEQEDESENDEASGEEDVTDTASWEAQPETVGNMASKPLKLKKFLNVMNSLTMGNSTTISETVYGFNQMVSRLSDFGILGNDVSDPARKVAVLQKWEDLYNWIVDPASWPEDLAAKRYAKELYYLSVWNVTGYIPVIMRIMYRNLKLNCNEGGFYSDAVVKNLLKAILIAVVHTRIILNRKHAEDRDNENKLKVVDYILDGYRSIHNDPNFGKSEKDVSMILKGIGTMAQELTDKVKAEDAIRAYQYTSSGSKFLLALYADDLDCSRSKVRDLECTKGKAQVEHMVPQNLEDGYFEDYGFDVSSIGLLDNLILLSEHKNKKIGNGNPEVKLAAWKGDPFGQLFVLPEDIGGTGFRDTQKDKVDSILNKFIRYFKTENARSIKQTFTFAKKVLKNGELKKLEWCPNRELLSGDKDTRYLRLNNDSFEEHPKNNNNTARGFWVKRKGRDIEKPEDLSAFSMIEAFLAGISPQKSASQAPDYTNIYDWLRKCENSIEKSNIKNGKSKVTVNGVEFSYSQKMIHTDAFLRDNSDTLKIVMGRAIEQNKTTEIEVDGNKRISICNDFAISEIIFTLSQIYAHYESKIPTGFWVELQKEKPVFIGHILIQTNYVNIGDPDMYHSWIKEQNEYKDKFLSAPAAKSESSTPPFILTPAVESYYSCDTQTFQDLIVNQKYRLAIPEYQRKYVWDAYNWDELYKQLCRASQNNQPLFLGTIVLRVEADACYIVDGQQRLTTLVAFYNAVKEPESPLTVLPNNNLLKKICEFLEERGGLTDVNCTFDVIYISGPKSYQYDVFSSINSAGKKLTIEEKIKNYLLMKYPKAKVDDLKTVANNPGFAKALCECVNGEFCKSADIYNQYKKIIEEKGYDFSALMTFSNIFLYIKGKQELTLIDDPKTGSISTPIWVKLLNGLEVSTADSLLLNWAVRIISNNGDKDIKSTEAKIEEITKRVCIIFFLLYVMDRSGNGAKSADRNFPKCMDLKGKSMAEQIVSAKADQPYWEKVTGRAEEIWKQYIVSLPIYDLGQARIKRFVLLMLEYMMINDSDTEDTWKMNVNAQDKLDIEHIFPSSEKNWPKGYGTLISPTRLNYLENVMLLEGEQNKKAKAKMLIQQGDGGKMTEYRQSSLFMAKMFCKSSPCEYADQNGIYDSDAANKRMNDLKDRILPRFSGLLDLVLDKKEIVPEDCKFPFGNSISAAKAKLSSSGNKNPAKKGKQSSVKKVSTKKVNKRTHHLQQVILHATRFAIEEKNCGEDYRAKASKIKSKAIHQVFLESKKNTSYKTTILCNVTRDIKKIGTADELERLLKDLWDGGNDLLQILGADNIPPELPDLIAELSGKEIKP